MGEVAALGILYILQQTARGADSQFQRVATKTLQVMGLELCVQGAAGALRIELPGGLAAGTTALGDRRVKNIFVVKGLCWIQSLQFTGQGFLSGHFQHPEAARAQVQVGHAIVVLVLGNGQ